MDEIRQTAALEGIDADPIQPEVLVVDGFFDAGDEAGCVTLHLGVGVPIQLQVDAVDVVGRFVPHGGLAGVDLGFKPEPAFTRKIGLPFDGGDQETLCEPRAGEIQVQPGTGGCAGAVAGDHLVG